ncbi:MAG: hypothetical protein IT340_22110 [Chloroflexi bacterium]|nr:hypothetical protein [Chloroflexota bacterium]
MESDQTEQRLVTMFLELLAITGDPAGQLVGQAPPPADLVALWLAVRRLPYDPAADLPADLSYLRGVIVGEAYQWMATWTLQGSARPGSIGSVTLTYKGGDQPLRFTATSEGGLTIHLRRRVHPPGRRRPLYRDERLLTVQLGVQAAGVLVEVERVIAEDLGDEPLTALIPLRQFVRRFGEVERALLREATNLRDWALEDPGLWTDDWDGMRRFLHWLQQRGP